MKYIILLIFILAYVNLFSQTEKENWLIGGQGSFSRQNSSGVSNKYLSLSASPMAGIFIQKNWALGLKTDLHFFSSEFDSLKWKGYTTNFLPFLRIYTPNIKKSNFALLLEWAFGYGINTQFNQTFAGNNTINYKTFGNQFTSSLSIGFCYFIRQNISFEGLFYYQGTKGTYTTEGILGAPDVKTDNRFSDIGFRFGLQFILDKRVKE
jgi:hypothetical protein